jgi:hypothetical protein
MVISHTYLGQPDATEVARALTYRDGKSKGDGSYVVHGDTIRISAMQEVNVHRGLEPVSFECSLAGEGMVIKSGSVTSSDRKCRFIALPATAMASGGVASAPAAAGTAVGATARGDDLRLLQGSWRPRKVYHLDSRGTASESSAIYGGTITIEGNTFSEECLDFNAPGKTRVITYSLVLAGSTTVPPTMTLRSPDGQTTRAIYYVDESTFEFVRCDPGVEPPSTWAAFGTSSFVRVDKGQWFYQCVKVERKPAVADGAPAEQQQATAAPGPMSWAGPIRTELIRPGPLNVAMAVPYMEFRGTGTLTCRSAKPATFCLSVDSDALKSIDRLQHSFAEPLVTFEVRRSPRTDWAALPGGRLEMSPGDVMEIRVSIGMHSTPYNKLSDAQQNEFAETCAKARVIVAAAANEAATSAPTSAVVGAKATPSIVGIVVDVDGRPVGNVWVDLLADDRDAPVTTTRTDSEGRFAIPLGAVIDGKFMLRCKSGDRGGSIQVAVAHARPTPAEVRLVLKSLSGRS